MAPKPFALTICTLALILAVFLRGDTADHSLPSGSQALCLQNVRLRDAPSISAAPLKTVPRGQVLSALAIRDTAEQDTPFTRWCQVESVTGDAGWISLDFVSLNRPGPLNPRTRRPALIHMESRFLAYGSDYAALGLSGVNKINGRIYRLRSHRLPGEGQWIGPAVPAAVPHVLPSGLELNILDDHPEGWLAFYRSPPGTGAYDTYEARFYGQDGTLQWSVGLDRFLPDGQPREIQDIRLVPPRLFFNAACASYSRESGDRCSELVAIHPDTGEELWRTPHLVSNNIFIPAGAWLICGYGFTSEPDFLYIVDQISGQVLTWQALDSAADYLEIRDDVLWVTTYNYLHSYRMASPPSRQ
ncbi:MAG: SH3 domain-containing protein [Acidobacteria bacterium]|nr:SH3 domain-containing protein [Acidobacteriota bacterium]